MRAQSRGKNGMKESPLFETTHPYMQSNGITMHIAEAGEGPRCLAPWISRTVGLLTASTRRLAHP